jgi:hypothetical protein
MKNYLIFEQVQEKNCASLQRIKVHFLNKIIVTKLSEIWVEDPGSEIRDPEKKNLSRIKR